MWDRMVRSLTGITLALLIVSCTGVNRTIVTKGKSEAPLDDEAAVDQLLLSFQEEYNAHHPRGVANLYTRNARWQAAAGPILEGRLIITLALQQFMDVVPPTLTLNEESKVIIDDTAVSCGTYVMSGEVDGIDRSIGGAYFTVLKKNGETWQIIAQQMNYNFPMTAEMWVGQFEAVQTQAEEGKLNELITAYEDDFNAGEALQLAQNFAEDTWVSFGGRSAIEGREAVAQHLEQEMAGGRQLNLHETSTILLNKTTAVDRGWYELIDDQAQVQWGTYTLLARQNAEGKWQIEQFVATNSP